MDDISLVTGQILMSIRKFLTAIVFLVLLAGCNSSNSGTLEISVDPQGVWSVRFTELVDQCDVLGVDEEGVGFISEETITKEGEVYTVTADELVFGSIDGMLRSNNSLIAEGDFTGDIFLQGFNCTLTERLAYNDLTESSANIVYEVTISCDDGTRCDSVFRAEGERLESISPA